MKEKILFVTRGCDQCDLGFPYVAEFAKTLNKEIEVLIMQPAGRRTSLESIFAAVAFAEEGDVASAVKALLKDSPYIDMVMISPILSEKSSSLSIRKLLRTISKPIVHISRPATAEI